MIRMHRQDSGFTLIELLLVCTLMLVVLGATLTTFESFQSNAETNQRMNDAQDEARRSLEGLARELRNLASPTNEEPQAVKRALGTDLIVQSVASTQPAGSLNSRNTQYVRYCLDTTTKRVYRQRKTWTTATDPAFPNGGNCPAAGWDTTEYAGGYVVNGSRSLFTYNSTVLTNITEIHTTMWIDVNPGTKPAETPISTTVFLRNQNRVPVASFSAAPSGGRIVLNGSASEDPEERALRYFWFDNNVTTNSCSDSTLVGCVGEGIVYEYTPPAPGNRTVHLIVKDPADLQSQAPNQTVCVPGTGVTC